MSRGMIGFSPAGANVGGDLTGNVSNAKVDRLLISAPISRPSLIPPGVGGIRVSRPVSTTYRQWVQIEADWWWRLDLKQVSGLPGSATTWFLADSSGDLPWLSVDHLDTSVVRSGAGWTGPTTQAAAYGGSYHQNNTGVGQYVEWTTPASVTRVGVRTVSATNAGIALVTLNGSTTAANLLPTAQTLVNEGKLASSALVANGGTLNPADRVLDGYVGATAPNTVIDYDRHYAIADGLAAGAHVVRLTNTGYQNVQATGARLYDSGWTYGTATTTASTGGMELLPHTRFLSTFQSAYEYAHELGVPAGSNYTFVGTVHGYETTTSIQVLVNGLGVTMNVGDTVAGETVEIVKTGQLRHPNHGAGASNAGDVITLYKWSKSGLIVGHRVTWQATGDLRRSYPVMFPLDNRFDAGAIGDSTALTLTSNDGSFKGAAYRDWASLWESVGRWVATVQAVDPVTTLNSYTNAGGTMTSIEDRAPLNVNQGAVNKVYMSRVSPSGISIPVTAGTTVHRSTARYQMGRFADVSLVMAG